MRTGAQVLDTHIDAMDWAEAIRRIVEWGAGHESRYVTLCNVHSVVTASQDANFREVIQGADMALPDGAPVAWAMRHDGFPQQRRLNGPDLMWRYLAKAELIGQSVFFYGSTDTTLERLRIQITTAFPKLHIAGLYSPPFRELSVEEDQSDVDLINASGANAIFVGLGCPKQEVWMAQHRGRIHGVMLGVGAAFDYHAGTIQRAPAWMQKTGLEWFHRLCSEPRRLAHRYTNTNSIFLYRTFMHMLMRRRS